jgi:hypothetical protein
MPQHEHRKKVAEPAPLLFPKFKLDDLVAKEQAQVDETARTALSNFTTEEIDAIRPVVRRYRETEQSSSQGGRRAHPPPRKELVAERVMRIAS